jgi:uncharacterized protein (DUF885 family)
MSNTFHQELHQCAEDYYEWQKEQYPVSSSHQGFHRWDDRLTDYSREAIAARRDFTGKILDRLSTMRHKSQQKDDYVDYILFRAQIEGAILMDGILDSPARDPQLYVNECSNAIFSLLKKEYAPAHARLESAISRMKAMPKMLSHARENLTAPVRLFCRLAVRSASAIGILFNESLGKLVEGAPEGLASAYVEARDVALNAINSFSSWLEEIIPSASEFAPMGEKAYEALLSTALLLPLSADELLGISRTELARLRTQEAWLADPAMADPDPARSACVPKSQSEFLEAYEKRQAEVLDHIRERGIINLPAGIGPFHIRELPAAFRPTSPGGFMNPPGIYDEDPSGFYFIPTYSPDSPNFYIRAAIEEPRPILAHEGIPGHFLQISISRKLDNKIRAHHHDSVFIEGWALYTEEMLLRTGLYPEGSAGHGQVLRLGRYRAARVEIDAELHRGHMRVEEAAQRFREAGGLDSEAAEGEALGAASRPTQKITYTVGKWQIMELLGRYRDRKGRAFRLGDFHDELLSYGSLPLTVINYLLFDDSSLLDAALEKREKARIELMVETA